jgi:hypothetical protein
MQLDQAQQATLSGAHELGVAIRQKRLATGLTLALAAPMCGVSLIKPWRLPPSSAFDWSWSISDFSGNRLRAGGE